MGYRDVMQMPIRAFWVFNRNIGRISAKHRMDRLEIATHSQGGEAAKELFTQLSLTLGEVVTPDVTVEPLDRAGLNELRNM